MVKKKVFPYTDEVTTLLATLVGAKVKDKSVLAAADVLARRTLGLADPYWADWAQYVAKQLFKGKHEEYVQWAVDAANAEDLTLEIAQADLVALGVRAEIVITAVTVDAVHVTTKYHLNDADRQIEQLKPLWCRRVLHSHNGEVHAHPYDGGIWKEMRVIRQVHDE